MTATARTQLLEGIMAGNFDMVQSAVKAGADVNERYGNVRVATKLYKDGTPLYFALENGWTDIARYLIAENADALAIINGNTTPLHTAAQHGVTDIITDLAEKSVNLDYIVPGTDTGTALHVAAHKHDYCTVKTLLECGASPNIGHPPVMFHMDVDSKSIAIATELLASGANLMATDLNGRSYLDSAPSKLRRLCEGHLINIENRLSATATSGMPIREMVVGGKPTTLLNHMFGAGKLNELFSQQRWDGRERGAIKLYQEISAAVPPYYRPAFNAIDMSAIHDRAISQPLDVSAVERYTRPSLPSKNKGGIG